MTLEEKAKRYDLIISAAKIQAEDFTLWGTNVGKSYEDFTVTAGEAYVQQSLRNLHRVIEEGCLESFNSIKEQCEDS